MTHPHDQPPDSIPATDEHPQPSESVPESPHDPAVSHQDLMSPRRYPAISSVAGTRRRRDTGALGTDPPAGAAITAAVFAFLQAGITVLATVIMMMVVNEVSDTVPPSVSTPVMLIGWTVAITQLTGATY
jgi:hypothetical protein